MISGLNKTDLVLVASRPGMGKTSIALNMALAAAKGAETDCNILAGDVKRAARSPTAGSRGFCRFKSC